MPGCLLLTQDLSPDLVRNTGYHNLTMLAQPSVPRSEIAIKRRLLHSIGGRAAKAFYHKQQFGGGWGGSFIPQEMRATSRRQAVLP